MKLLALAAMLVATSSAVAPETVTQAQVIRAEVGAKYRLAPGRKLLVTEATSTGVVDSISLITDWLEPPRAVPAGNGIYFAICSARATCPYPRRSAAWRPLAFRPRRQALELALRSFRETSADLVVVALPTAQPVWLVFERDDFLATVDSQTVLEQLAPSPGVSDKPLQDLVDRLTRPRLFVPLLGLPPPEDTIYAAQLIPR